MLLKSVFHFYTKRNSKFTHWNQPRILILLPLLKTRKSQCSYILFIVNVQFIVGKHSNNLFLWFTASLRMPIQFLSRDKNTFFRLISSWRQNIGLGLKLHEGVDLWQCCYQLFNETLKQECNHKRTSKMIKCKNAYSSIKMYNSDQQRPFKCIFFIVVWLHYLVHLGFISCISCWPLQKI